MQIETQRSTGKKLTMKGHETKETVGNEAKFLRFNCSKLGTLAGTPVITLEQ
jgi:hypothetical protein